MESLLLPRLTPGVLRWTAPGLRETSLANLASTIGHFLRGGGSLDDALKLTAEMERGNRVGRELEEWRARLAQGDNPVQETASRSRAFPSLFVWLASQGGEDPASGFEKAALVYGERGRARTEVLLFLVTPAAVLALGATILLQFLPVVRMVRAFFDPMIAF